MFTQKCIKGIELEGFLREYEDIVNAIFQSSIDIWNGVWESVTFSAAMGGILTGM